MITSGPQGKVACRGRSAALPTAVCADCQDASFRYAAAGDDTHYEALLGGHLRLVATDRLSLNADFEYAFNDGVESSVSGQLGIEFIF